MSRSKKRPVNRPAAGAVRQAVPVSPSAATPRAVPSAAGSSSEPPVLVWEGGRRRSSVVAAALDLVNRRPASDVLKDLAAVRREVDELSVLWVERGRDEGLSWDELGAQLEIPGETLRRRHRP